VPHTVLDRLVVEAWAAHPLVREAHRGLEDEASIVDLFENLSRVLSDLEARFPGLPFRTLLEAPLAPSMQQVRKRMLQAGVSQDDIDLIFSTSRT
jgi:hypothetical protein